ncbi:MAG TPA: glycoside hydrolase family 97 catalytic domain-containing protein, partial [Ohtaekwangia sp.]|nr:glycoside hydrolase family 97 catalytic domain-containing protein [Ohtaekwangia sp.]
MDKRRLAFLPVLVETGSGKKVCITESDLEDYPGMYVRNADGGNTLTGYFAAYPRRAEKGGHNQLQQIVRERENYIARVNGPRSFPWRVLQVAANDKELADSDLVYKLASPSRVTDLSWIKPGKVAWDWWNDWNIRGVDFVAGVNTATYKHYIDFAAENKIEYVILDEGWAVNLKADLFEVVPEIDLKEILSYAKSKNVDIILWAGYNAFAFDMENVCRHYAAMGVKGFKVDFMDRDDQEMVNFYYEAAGIAARHKMLIDFHGAYKPTGLNRTYPNVINFEGVHGLEQMKWQPPTVDQVTYDVTIPFVRMLAGPMDYTQGATRNATRSSYRPVFSEPMSQGTRCRQLAEYVIFEAPLNMLSDTPSNYRDEPEMTGFIAAVPTVWDETVVLSGKVAEHIVIARQSGNTWYLGAMTNWDNRTLEIELSFLPPGEYNAEIFMDGVNAHRNAHDFATRKISVNSTSKLTLPLAPGGGYAARITPASKNH